jgi:hypothetical protein
LSIACDVKRSLLLHVFRSPLACVSHLIFFFILVLVRSTVRSHQVATSPANKSKPKRRPEAECDDDDDPLPDSGDEGDSKQVGEEDQDLEGEVEDHFQSADIGKKRKASSKKESKSPAKKKKSWFVPPLIFACSCSLYPFPGAFCFLPSMASFSLSLVQISLLRDHGSSLVSVRCRRKKRS